MYTIDELLTNETAFNETLQNMNAVIDKNKGTVDSMNGGIETPQQLGDLLDKIGTGDAEEYACFCNSGNEDY